MIMMKRMKVSLSNWKTLIYKKKLCVRFKDESNVLFLKHFELVFILCNY